MDTPVQGTMANPSHFKDLNPHQTIQKNACKIKSNSITVYTQNNKAQATQPLAEEREIKWPRRARLQKLSLPANSHADQHNLVMVNCKSVLQTQIKINKITKWTQVSSRQNCNYNTKTKQSSSAVNYLMSVKSN